MSKYKVTFTNCTLETDDIDLVREVCGLSKAQKVEVDTPNESIDPEWNKFLSDRYEEYKKYLKDIKPEIDKINDMHKKAKQQQPVSPSSAPLNPLDNPWIKPYNPLQPLDNWRHNFPRDYTHIQDPLFPQTIITC